MVPQQTGTWFSSHVIVTQMLIATNVAVFIASVALGDSLTGTPSENGLILEAATRGVAIDVLNEWWRVFTGGFLHHGLFHLAVNMYSLFILGLILEQSLGRIPFAAVYFSSLVSGSFGALLETPDALVAGASGAIFGLLGAYAALSLNQGVSLFRTPLGMILIINLAISLFVRSISLGGHIGGLLGGFIVGMATAQAFRRQYHPIAIILLVAVVVAAGSFAGALWAATRWA
ncbi:rhomboid family intramembrane serine protease [Candidatus Poriferisocius sp.]|uniref:rhomboid family intramembrane serine protease n=1 Tax=Candidatus Poriferisocius sp. TaxID=3101276 RepID=UPI003B0127FC